MPSVFTRIVQGEIPCYKIAEDDRFLSFLDVNPITEGHVLVIPKAETDYIFNLSEKDYNDLWAFARKVAGKVKKAVPCKRVGIAVIGLEVPHAHIHLVPLNVMDDINFSRPKLSLPSEEMEKIAEAIRTA